LSDKEISDVESEAIEWERKKGRAEAAIWGICSNIFLLAESTP
jgi:transcriptional regulator GlxA family with amidase domain